MGDAPFSALKSYLCVCGGVHDVITGNKFHQNWSRGFRTTGVRKLGTPIDLACRPYNSSALPCWLW